MFGYICPTEFDEVGGTNGGQRVFLHTEFGIYCCSDVVSSSPGLRSGLLVVDDSGYSFTPTALYLEPEVADDRARNAIRLSREQLDEAMVRLSPSARAVAIASQDNEGDRTRIEAIPQDLVSTEIGVSELEQVGETLFELPPVEFDLARQVRVFEPYLQYVELSLSGASIQRHRIAIPGSIQALGGGKDIEGRLRTTFELIEKGSNLSSKKLDAELLEIRKDFTRSLGKTHGRVILRGVKPRFEQRLRKLRDQLEAHRKEVSEKLQDSILKAQQSIVDYYLPLVEGQPPDQLLGQMISGNPTKAGIRQWLVKELDAVLPSAADILKEMKLEVRYKDVTFETLDAPDFLNSVEDAYPLVDWERAYSEFRAAGEKADDAGDHS